MFKRGNKQVESARRTVANNRPAPDSFSYYRSSRRQPTGADVRRSEQAAAERRDVSKMLRLSAVCVILLIALIKLLYVSTSPNVIIPEDHNVYREPSEYTTAVEAAIKASDWHGSKLTFDDAAVRDELFGRLPELAQVEIIIPLINNRPVVRLTFLPPGLIIQSNKTSYVTASSGRIVNRRTPASKALILPQIIDESNTVYAEGTYGFSEASVRFITELQHQLADKKVSVSKWSLPTGSIAELRMQPAQVSYGVKFDLNGDALQQAGTYLAARGAISEQGLAPKEYIDARIAGKAYIK